MRITREEAQPAASYRREWRLSVARCIHLDDDGHTVLQFYNVERFQSDLLQFVDSLYVFVALRKANTATAEQSTYHLRISCLLYYI